jgi:4-diphosphocytidyl-2C-methyl-D-erythritol kinase
VFWFVLGISTTQLSTADVYARWRADRPTTWADYSAIVEAVRTGDPTSVAALLHNDLSDPAFALRPELKEAATAMVDAGALGSCLSGSGPTIFGVARDRAHAERVAGALAGNDTARHGSAEGGIGILSRQERNRDSFSPRAESGFSLARSGIGTRFDAIRVARSAPRSIEIVE